MGAKMLRLAAFLAGTALVVAAIKAVNWLPAALQPDVLRRHESVEEARASSGVEQILVPSYYPQELGWPPSAILAQGRPYPAVVLEFTRAGGRDAALVVTQWAAGRPRPEGRIPIAEVQETVRYSLRGRDAVLTVGRSPAGERVSRIGWAEGKYLFEISGKVSPVDLVKAAESMLR